MSTMSDDDDAGIRWADPVVNEELNRAVRVDQTQDRIDQAVQDLVDARANRAEFAMEEQYRGWLVAPQDADGEDGE